MATGDIAFLARLRDRYPEGLLTVMRLPGMGPKKTHLVWAKAGVADMRDLKKAAREGRLRGIPGMGEKTEANILRAIESWTAAAAGEDRGRRLRAQVEPQADRFVDALRALPEVVAADLAGSLRRRRATVRDIDLVAASIEPGAVMAAFAALPEMARVEAQGETKLAAATYSGLNVDLRVVPPESYGNLLQHFTGSADHNVALRGYAQRHGYKISEYGVEQLESGRLIRCATEAEVYELVRSALHPSGVARRPGGDPGGRSRNAPRPGGPTRSARRLTCPLRLDRRPSILGTDGPCRPRPGLGVPLLLRPLAVPRHDGWSGTRAADGPAGRDPSRGPDASTASICCPVSRWTSSPTAASTSPMRCWRSSTSSPRAYTPASTSRRRRSWTASSVPCGIPTSGPSLTPAGASSAGANRMNSISRLSPVLPRRPAPIWRSTARQTASTWSPPLRGGRRL